MDHPQPTVLFVHGAWHSPDLHYGKLLAALKDGGFDVASLKMPSAGGTRPPIATLNDDVAAIRSEALRLVELGSNVLIVAHSYGGIVATSAISDEMTWSARQKAGKAGGVVQIVYFCAFLPQVGGGVASICGAYGLPPAFDVFEDGATLPFVPFDTFYRDVDQADAKRYADHLHVQPISTFTAGATGEAWRFLPITYIYCTQDVAIPYGLQQQLLTAAKDGGALDVRTEVMESSHSPHANLHLASLVDMVKKAWDAYAFKYHYPARV